MNDVVAKLQKSLDRGSLSSILADRVDARVRCQKRSSFLLLDCSGSMAEDVEPRRAKIDALRDIVVALRKQIGFIEIVFPAREVREALRDYIPAPKGSTPLHDALAEARRRGAKKVVVVSDGLPDDTSAALAEARQLKSRGVKIDVFYVGPRPHVGEEFLRLLAAETGGDFESTSLESRQISGLIDRAAAALALPAPR